MLTFLTIGIVYAFTAIAQPGPYRPSWFRRRWRAGGVAHGPRPSRRFSATSPSRRSCSSSWSGSRRCSSRGSKWAAGSSCCTWPSSPSPAWRRFDPDEKPPVHSGAGSLLKAALINLLNPNPYIGWSLVMGPLAVKAWHQAHVSAFALLAGFYGTMVTGMLIVVVAASALGGIGAMVKRLLLGVSSFALACFGLFELWLGGRGLLG